MPVGIDISPDGKVIVADTGNHRIQVFSKEGSFLWSFSLHSGPRGDPTDVCAQEAGDVFYVCDNDNHQVHAYTSRGELLQILGKRGEALGAFRYPATVTLDGKNNVCVVDALNARVQLFDPHGKVLRQISEWGNSPGKLLRPKGVAIDGDGRVFVSDSHTGRIQVFSSEGAYVGFVADEGGEVLRFVTPTNILFDDNGRFYVVETRANRVRVLRIIGS
jgi:DNA-binding beta-propeller fold protein YncE